MSIRRIQRDFVSWNMRARAQSSETPFLGKNLTHMELERSMWSMTRGSNSSQHTPSIWNIHWKAKIKLMGKHKSLKMPKCCIWARSNCVVDFLCVCFFLSLLLLLFKPATEMHSTIGSKSRTNGHRHFCTVARDQTETKKRQTCLVPSLWSIWILPFDTIHQFCGCFFFCTHDDNPASS